MRGENRARSRTCRHRRAALRQDAQNATTIRNRSIQTEPERLLHEAECVDEVALARAVRADQDRERPELHIARDDTLVVLQLDARDSGGRLIGHAQVYDVAMSAVERHRSDDAHRRRRGVGHRRRQGLRRRGRAPPAGRCRPEAAPRPRRDRRPPHLRLPATGPIVPRQNHRRGRHRRVGRGPRAARAARHRRDRPGRAGAAAARRGPAGDRDALGADVRQHAPQRPRRRLPAGGDCRRRHRALGPGREARRPARLSPARRAVHH